MPNNNLNPTHQQLLTHIPTLYKKALHLTKNPQDAEDLTQETLTKALTYIHTYTPGTNLAAWLHTILHNTYITHQTNKKHPHTQPITPTNTPTTPSPEQQLLNHTPHHNTQTLLHQIPPHTRTLLYHTYVLKTPINELAHHYNLPPGTIKSKINRAKKILQKNDTTTKTPNKNKK